MPDSEVLDDNQFDLGDLLTFFESEADSCTANTRSGYKAALGLLRGFIASRRNEIQTLTPALLEDLYVSMYVQGLSPKTASHYIDALSGLYRSAVKAGIAPPTDMFAILRTRIKDAVATSAPAIDEQSYIRFSNLTKTSPNLRGEPGLMADMLLMSFALGCLPVLQVARMTCRDLDHLDGETKAIAWRNVSPIRKFIFALDQSQFTPRQLSRHISEKLVPFLKSRGIAVIGGSVDETVRSIWAYAALKCGVSASVIVAVLGFVPAGIPAMAVCTVDDTKTVDRQAVIGIVNNALFDNPLRWFAMRLRPAVRYDSLTRRLDLLHKVDRIDVPELFYPCEAIACKIGRKLVFKDKPFISDVVFFKSRVTDIYPLFVKLADLAWCYRTSSSEGMRYASIPASAMQRFQAAIGRFTDDYEVAPAGCLDVRQGDRVVIIGGDYAGKDALVESVDGTAEAGVIYRVIFSADNGIEWRVSIDPRQLQAK